MVVQHINTVVYLMLRKLHCENIMKEIVLYTATKANNVFKTKSLTPKSAQEVVEDHPGMTLSVHRE